MVELSPTSTEPFERLTEFVLRQGPRYAFEYELFGTYLLEEAEVLA